ncbi:MAG TPA: hypothetical protein VGJ07_11150 [Rugosimonospora sp.]|jgi:hypothetical protein
MTAIYLATGGPARPHEIDHGPIRPLWRCGSCLVDWPCNPVSDLLTRVHGDDREGLAGHLARLMAVAARELGSAGSAKLYKRFLGWTLDGDEVCRVCCRRGHDVLPGLPPRLFPCDGSAIEPIHHPDRHR